MHKSKNINFYAKTGMKSNISTFFGSQALKFLFKALILFSSSAVISKAPESRFSLILDKVAVLGTTQ